MVRPLACRATLPSATMYSSAGHEENVWRHYAWCDKMATTRETRQTASRPSTSATRPRQIADSHGNRPRESVGKRNPNRHRAQRDLFATGMRRSVKAYGSAHDAIREQRVLASYDTAQAHRTHQPRARVAGGGARPVDFSIQDDGVCRLNPQFARRVVQFAVERCAEVRST